MNAKPSWYPNLHGHWVYDGKINAEYEGAGIHFDGNGNAHTYAATISEKPMRFEHPSGANYIDIAYTDPQLGYGGTNEKKLRDVRFRLSMEETKAREFADKVGCTVTDV